MYFWYHAGRLKPMKLAWFAGNYRSPRYLEAKQFRPRLKREAPSKALTLINWDRVMRREYPGPSFK